MSNKIIYRLDDEISFRNVHFPMNTILITEIVPTFTQRK